GSRMAAGIQIFIDGRPVPYKALQDNLYRPFRNAGKAFNQPFRIGGGGGLEKRFRGRIDEVRIYARVLDGQEIAALALGAAIAEIAAKPAATRSAIEKLQLRADYLENLAPPQTRDAWKWLTALREEREKL